MKKYKLMCITLIVLVFLLSNTSFAINDVPLLINYQGILTDSKGSPLEGSKKLEFNIYDSATAGTKVWGPQIFNSVPVIKGRFNVILGTTDNVGRLISEAFDESNRFIGIKMHDGVELEPRQKILSVPFAIHSMHSQHSTTASSAFSVSAVNIKGLIKSSQLEDTLSCKQLSASSNITVTNDLIVGGNLIGGKRRSKEFFTSDTWQVPSGIYRLYITGIGGGGGGGGSLAKDGWYTTYEYGGGGGSGLYIISYPIEINEQDNINIIIGKGGKGGASGNKYIKNYSDGNHGTDSIIEKLDSNNEKIKLLTIPGGTGGRFGSYGSGGSIGGQSGNMGAKGGKSIFGTYGCGGHGGTSGGGSSGCDGYILIEY